MIGKVELPAFCCAEGGNLAGNRLKSKILQILSRIVDSTENIKFRDFFSDYRISEFWRAC